MQMWENENIPNYFCWNQEKPQKIMLPNTWEIENKNNNKMFELLT